MRSRSGSTSRPARLQRLGVAELAQPRRLEVGAAADEADPAVAEVEQVLGRELGAAAVVGVDGRDLVAAGVGVDGDDRAAGRRPDDRGRHEQRTVDERAAEPAQRAVLPADVVGALAAGRVDDELVAGAAQRPGDALDELGAEGLDVGHEHADDVGAVVAQAARHDARLVAQLVDDALHARRGGGRDAVALVDDLGDGRDGDPGLDGDVPDRHSSQRRHGVSVVLDNVVDNA